MNWTKGTHRAHQTVTEWSGREGRRELISDPDSHLKPEVNKQCLDKSGETEIWGNKLFINKYQLQKDSHGD